MDELRPATHAHSVNGTPCLPTLIGAIQALRSGTTTIVDDLNVSPQLDPIIVDAAFQAYRDIGIGRWSG